MQSDKTYRYEVMPTLGQDPQGRMFYKGNSEKRITYLVMNKLSKLGTTNIVITDEQKGSEHLTVDGVKAVRHAALLDAPLFCGMLEDMNTSLCYSSSQAHF